MAKVNEIVQKHLAATGAVTTNNKAGILHGVIFNGAKAADTLIIKDGATTMYTLLINTGLDPIILWFPADSRPVFATDIDATLTLDGAGYATFIYKEISQ